MVVCVTVIWLSTKSESGKKNIAFIKKGARSVGMARRKMKVEICCEACKRKYVPGPFRPRPPPGPSPLGRRREREVKDGAAVPRVALPLRNLENILHELGLIVSKDDPLDRAALREQ